MWANERCTPSGKKRARIQDVVERARAMWVLHTMGT
jgi:hypothetical protein